MGEKIRPATAILAICVALAISSFPALGEDEVVDVTPPKAERPTTLDRPIGLKPYFLSRPPARLSPGDEQRAADYRSNLEGEIKRLERRQGHRRDRREFDRMQSIQRERGRIGRIIRR